jgi:hypothetical protein
LIEAPEELGLAKEALRDVGALDRLEELKALAEVEGAPPALAF